MFVCVRKEGERDGEGERHNDIIFPSPPSQYHRYDTTSYGTEQVSVALFNIKSIVL